MNKKYLKLPSSLKLPPTLKLWRTSRRTSIFNGLIIIMVAFNFLFFSLPGQASTRTDLEDNMDKTGREAWGAESNPTQMVDIIQTVISVFLGLLGIIFLILIIYSGFNWMTAGGDEEKVTLAKKTLSRSIIGLVIIIGAYSITYFVFTNLPG